MAAHTESFPLTFVARDHLHHGAGTAGNTALLRTQEIVLPDGTPTVVPYISGNSLRHQLRAAAAQHALTAMAVQHHSLPKAVVDLLWSGGALTRTGANTDLDTPREAAALFPALSLFGYSAGATMAAGRLRVDNIHLVCKENVWRLPPMLAATEQAALPAAAFRSDEFGTRHDAARAATPARYLDGAPADTNQMIYDLQTIKPGAVLQSTLRLDDASDAELDVLAAAVQTAAPDGVISLAAKSAVGYGRCQLLAPTALTRRDTTPYTELLGSHAGQIIDLWKRLVA